jgi:succinoglycan biosynthesis protein ExoM
VIAVCVCTYKRPDQLARLFESYLAIRDPSDIEFVVVDNDGSNPEVERLTQELAQKSGKKAHYVVETQPGISAARNAAFAKARAIGAEILAMVDDDEWVTPEWLRHLLDTMRSTGAKVVGGPVRPVFSEAKQKWAPHAKMWSVEREFLHGKPFVFCTCNFALELAAVAPLGEQPFNEAYGLTGGGDVFFFRQLANLGVPMAWSEEAFIHESIPDSRASLKWLRQRRYRVGNATYRWEVDVPTSGDMNPGLKTLISIARLPFFPLTGKGRGPLFLAWLLEVDKVRGRIGAQLGSHYTEYKRETPHKACR